MAYQNVSTIKPTHPYLRGEWNLQKLARNGGFSIKMCVCVCVEGGGLTEREDSVEWRDP